MYIDYLRLLCSDWVYKDLLFWKISIIFINIAACQKNMLKLSYYGIKSSYNMISDIIIESTKRLLNQKVKWIRELVWIESSFQLLLPSV